MVSTLLPPNSENHSGPNGTDAAFWHRLAPKKAAKAYARGDSPIAWTLWQKHLSERKFPTRWEKLLKTKRSPLLWTLPEDAAEPSLSELTLRLTAKKFSHGSGSPELSDLLAARLNQQSSKRPAHAQAIEALAITQALPRLASVCEADLWWKLVANLQQMAQDAAAFDVRADPLLTLWLKCELPLALAYVLPEINACRELWTPGSERLSAALVELLDGEGLPHARHLSLLRPILACCTRSTVMARALKEECLDEEAGKQYRWLVRHALELARRDGSQLLTPGSAGRWEPELFAAALKLGGQRRERDLAKASLPEVKSSKRKKVLGNARVESSTNSEWAALALLRAAWSPQAARMLVKYDRPSVEVELETERGLILSGAWEVELELSGRRVPVVGPWEELCWQADHDVVYVELETSLPGGLRVQRQILLARDEQFLFLADAVLNEQRGPITYRASLPLAGGTRFEPEAETREGYLSAEKPQALVLPLALPEWRTDPRHGSLSSEGDRLLLMQRAEAANLFCPLLIDLKPRRLTKKRTWRQLTVAENREIQPAERAVGYRAQCGNDQWIFYRSLGPKGNRTLLSHNLVAEFLAARFETDGTVEELLEIE
jgi:hypothetical protein